MKKISLAVLISLLAAGQALAANDKIDPQTFICAELVATGTDKEPPLFEGLQLDGYASALAGQPAADAMSIRSTLIQTYDSCTAKPAEKALAHWQEARKNNPAATDGVWRADRATCADYYANEDDGSGFIIWLDGYQRAKTGKTASVFTDQPTLDHFLETCKANPKRLVYDVMIENAK